MAFRFYKYTPLLYLLIFISHGLLGQSNIEQDRITELYDIIEDQSKYYGTEVYIYDRIIKGKKIFKDSTLVARITIIDNQDIADQYVNDTTDLTITKYLVDDNNKIPKIVIRLDAHGNHIENVVVNDQLETLSKTIFTYNNNNKLVSEEAYTGYAYLDNPRKISNITYAYDNDRLKEKVKKYSLNGTHWVQTWVTKYDAQGRKILLEETDNDELTSYSYNYNVDGKLDKITIQLPDGKQSIKEIKYNSKNHPISVFWYKKKRNKPIRLTTYIYK